MLTIYIYANELLGDNGDQFNDESFVDTITCESEDECNKNFEDMYGSNDYSYSYTRHE